MPAAHEGTTRDLLLSDLGQRLGAQSGIEVLMSDLGEALAHGGPDTVMMGGGNPAHIPEIEAVWRRRLQEILAEQGAMEAMLGDYDAPRGKASFVEAVADYFRSTQGWDIGPEHVVITAGSQTGCFGLFNLLAGTAGGRPRRVAFPMVPEYIGYADQVLEGDALRSFRPRVTRTQTRRFRYEIDFDALELDDVGALCLSRPTNPTAKLTSDEELAKLSELARARGIPLIVDNAYGRPFPDITFGEATLPPWEEHLVYTFSLSKLGLPAARTGITIARPDLAARLSAMNAIVGLANSGIGQTLVEPLIRSREIDRMCRDVIRPYYQARCQQALGWLDESTPSDVDFAVHEPGGAFFLWLWLPQLKCPAQEVYERLKARGVVVVSGHYFFPGLPAPWEHSQQCLRISYCQAPEALQRGIGIIGEEIARASR